jgi:heat shock protein HtpX
MNLNVAKTALLMAGLTALLAGCGLLLDRFLGTGGLMMIVFTLIGVVTNWISYFYSDTIVLKMYGAKEVSPTESPQLHQIVDRICARAGLPKPKVCIIPIDVPNAFATGRNPKHAAVACTQGILRALTWEELEGVIAHELGHVRNRDTLIATIAASIAGLIGSLAHVAQFGMIFGGHSDNDEGNSNPFALLLMIILAPIMAMIIQMAISRTREFAADRAAAQLTGNPDALASALQRLESYATTYPMGREVEATQHLFIVNPLTGKSMMHLFSTHPPTEERVKALQKIKQQMQHRNMTKGVTRPIAA